VPAVWLLARGGRHDDSLFSRFLVVRADGKTKSLTWDDVHAIGTIPSVHVAVPYLHKSLPVINDDVNWTTEVVGTTPDYLRLMAWQLAAGHVFDPSSSEKVVVLGDTVVKQMYGAGKLPVGETIRIDRTPFTIIGVLAHRGMTSQGQDLDDAALVPVDVYSSRIAPTLNSRFEGVVLVDSASVADEIRVLLRERHHLAPGDPDDFVVGEPPTS
jgi:putative ABC transport system permease protein